MLIAQISDFHLKPGRALAYDAADTAGALERVVSHINRLRPLPDVILATGDLADGGASESYFLARELLAHLKPPLFMVPGNHDQKGNMASVFSHHAYLAKRVRENSGDYMCFCIEDFPVRLLGLDTVTPGDHDGGLGPARLTWLNQKLGEDRRKPTIVFMHHPPFASGIGHMDQSPFKYREEFRKVILGHPQVKRVTCGHIHRPVFRSFAGTLATVCPGVGMQLDLHLAPDAPSGFVLEPPSFLLHFLDDSWRDGPEFLTHVGIVGDTPDQYGGFHPFFNVISPA